MGNDLIPVPGYLRKLNEAARNYQDRSRSNLSPAAAKAKCQEYCAEMIELWVRIARDEDEDTSVRLQASEKIFTRAYGRPAQSLDVAITDARNIEDGMVGLLDAMDIFKADDYHGRTNTNMGADSETMES